MEKYTISSGNSYRGLTMIDMDSVCLDQLIRVLQRKGVIDQEDVNEIDDYSCKISLERLQEYINKEEDMIEYPKTYNLFKRDESTKKLIIGDFMHPHYEVISQSKWFFEEKLDGEPTRVIFDGETVMFKSRTDNSEMRPCLLPFLNDVFTVEKMKEVFPEVTAESPVCLYGEGVGKGIQKDGDKYSNHPIFVLFDIRVGRHWLERDDVIDSAVKLGIRTPAVPLLQFSDVNVVMDRLHQIVPYLKERPNSIFAMNGIREMEGVIGRTDPYLYDNKGSRIMFKLKVKDLL